MRRAKKTALIAAIVCIVMGVIAVLAAFLMIGFDFKKLNTISFQAKVYEVEESFQNIEICDLECDIRLVPATDGQCKVVCQESNKIINAVEVKDNTLLVTGTDTRRWYERMGIWWGEDLSVTVYLPQIDYQSLYLNTLSGDIEVKDDFTFSKAELVSTSGDIMFAGRTEETLSVQSTSGDIRVKNSTAGSVKAVTISGDAILSNVTTDGLDVKTTSGDIEMTSVLVSGQASLETTSGDIEIERSDAGSFRLKTVSGDVEGSILSTKKFVTNTVSGDVRVPVSDLSVGICQITTTSGDIRINVVS